MTPQSDEDAVWQQIVASYNDTAERDSADQPWPDSENLPAEQPRRVVRPPEFDGPPFDEAGFEDPAFDDAAFDAQRPGSARAPDLEDADGHFVPAVPPPLPRTDLTTKMAWVALFGGPAYLLLAAMANWRLEGWTLFLAVAAFIGGFVALVIRMGDGPPNDSGWDDGAVI